MTGATTAAITLLAAALLTAVLLWWRERNRAASLRSQLLAEQQRADTASRAGDAFFDLVSHEIRSPIAAIIGYQELLSDGAYGMIGDGAMEPLSRIGRSARYLLDLVDGTVDLARARVGRLDPHLETVPLHEIIESAIQGFRTNAEERALNQATHVDPGIPDILSDPERLQRTLDLLLYSVVKHPSGSGIDLRVQRDPDGATIRIRGIRLPTRPEATDEALRTGIRLAIVASMTRLLDGELRLEYGAADTATELTLRIRSATFDGPGAGS
jgi:signal transduction histidine kinase